MKIVTCSSYFGTGSSAITDLLSEYSCIESLGSDFECRIVQDPHGISDLDYNLVENNHRHNSSNAIKDFKRLMGLYGCNKKTRMENYLSTFGDEFIEVTNEYIKKLIDMDYKGGCHIDIYRKNEIEILLIKLKMYLFRKFIRRKNLTTLDSSYLGKKRTPIEKVYHNETTYVSYPGDNFYTITKEFTENLFNLALKDKSNYLMVDQLVPPSNTNRYIRYFNDIKIICVDRDPRDLYILEKYYWKSGVIPIEIDEFINWYGLIRKHRDNDNDNPKFVLRLNFEELIFNYEESKSKIENFLNIPVSYHTKRYKYFNPDISIQNTRLWNKHPEYKEDINKILQNLSKFCYID